MQLMLCVYVQKKEQGGLDVNTGVCRGLSLGSKLYVLMNTSVYVEM